MSASLNARHLATAMILVAGAGALPLSAAEQVVEIRDYQFWPKTLQIKVGDTVRWVNREKRTSHSVLFPVLSLESERLFPDESWTRRFAAAGSYPYRCGPHPEMSGQIEVSE